MWGQGRVGDTTGMVQASPTESCALGTVRVLEAKWQLESRHQLTPPWSLHFNEPIQEVKSLSKTFRSSLKHNVEHVFTGSTGTKMLILREYQHTG